VGEVVVQPGRHLGQPSGVGGRGEHAGEVTVLGADLETGADHHEAGHLLWQSTGHASGKVATVGPTGQDETLALFCPLRIRDA
jgi:hypothetical protein